MNIIILPKVLNDAILKLDLSQTNLNRAYNFIQDLFYYTFIREDDNLLYGFKDISSVDIKEKYTSNYYRNFLSPMIKAQIIQRSPYFNAVFKAFYRGPEVTTSKCFGYKINDGLINLNELICVSFPRIFVKPNNKQKVRVIKALKRLSFDIEGMLSLVKNYSLNDDILLNEDVPDGPFDKVIVSDPKYNSRRTSKEKALERAAKAHRDLIYYKNNAYIYNLYDFKMQKTTSFQISQLYALNKLKNKDFYASINRTNFRLDTNLTNLKGMYLKEGLIKLDGEKLVDIDMKNCQPALLAYLLTNIEGVKQRFAHLKKYKFPDIDLTQPDVLQFTEAAGSGYIYNILCDTFHISRDSAKLTFIKIMFTKPCFNPTCKKQARVLFPTVIKWIDDFKKLNRNHRSFAIMLQRMESAIFIQDIYKKIQKDHVIFTKHDSVLCKESERDMVRAKMEKILDEYGFRYSLK